MKFIDRELIVDSGRRGRAGVYAVVRAILGLAFACGFPVAAQQPGAPPQTNDVTAAEVLSQLDNLAQGTDSAQPEDMAPPADLNPTNAAGGDPPNRFIRPDDSSRSQGNDRRSRGRRSRSGSGQSGASHSANDLTQTNGLAETANNLVSLDYAAFKIVVDRNIFDPNRYPHRPGEARVPTKPRSFDSLTLVGTMSYEKGTFAFFDGSSSQYQKALKLTDSIAGYKLMHIAPNGVKLASGTNELDLGVGAQLRREEDGPWLLTSQSTSYATASASTTNAAVTTPTGSDAASGGAESDILKRLMQKREKE